MILINPISIPASTVNPDGQSVQSKSQINISVSEFDISSSGANTTTKLSQDKSEIILTNYTDGDGFNTYYTPLYTEKISYSVWKTTINKSFNELGIE